MIIPVLLIIFIPFLIMLIVGGVKVVFAGSSKRKNTSATKTLWYANFGFGFIALTLVVLYVLHFFIP